MTINLTMPVAHDLKPRISVVGVGGAGGNAVNNMITAHLEGVEFVACNTDAQALDRCLTDRKIQLGNTVTHGLGAGARPEIGRAAAEEARNEIIDALSGSHMVFITAGMGGGTGTGAAPVIAKAVKEQGILTVGVVTKPFQFEGGYRARLAESGIEELEQWVDTLIVIPNQNLFRIANERTTFTEAFQMADQVLHMGVRGVTDLIVMPGLVNLDFADIRTVMSEMGKAMMGTGESEGERRAIEAAESAISNPLLDEVSMKGARGVLINITGGPDMTLFEVDAAANRIREEVDTDANIIFGSTFDESMQGKIRVSVVATGIAMQERKRRVQPGAPEVVASTAPAVSPLRFQPQAPRGIAQAYPTLRAATQLAPTTAQAVDAHIRAMTVRGGAGAEADAERADAYAPPAAAEPDAGYEQVEREYETAGADQHAVDRRSRNLSGLGRAEDRLSNLFSKMSKGLGFGGEAQGGEQRSENAHLRWEQSSSNSAAGGDPVAEIPAFLRRDRTRT
ncbi:cell division protein FtsZ [Geminicoccus flavidas]|uniref:cell division protein FtsZ n=1 Tax=Geminicoccus flavidas TaxID=2506407 RepID=UPI00135744E3|nr:cell division protein FtsZ [Geminicoccus flavidas]